MKNKSREDTHSLSRNLYSCEKKAWKIQAGWDSNRDRLCDAAALHPVKSPIVKLTVQKR